MYETEAFNIKPKVFPVPSSGMASSTSLLTSEEKRKKKKKKRFVLRERHFSKHNGQCFGPKWVAWLNGQWESVLRVSAWFSKSQQMQWKWTPFFMEIKEKKNILIQLSSCLYDYMWNTFFPFCKPNVESRGCWCLFINISGVLVCMEKGKLLYISGVP